VLQARVNSAKVVDREDIKLLCWTLPPPIASRACPTCAWTRATREKAMARIGCRRWWVGRPKSCDTRRSWSPRRWVRELTEEGLRIDREKLQAEPKGPRSFLPKRWIVERTFSWLSQNRRLSKDYERLPESAETLIYVAMSRLG